MVHLGQYQEAIDSLDQAIAHKPDLHDTWYDKACCYGLQQNVEAAIENFLIDG
jgi:tetratricopeptide (TPR) repeat protein